MSETIGETRLREALSANLPRLRKQQGLSQEALAKAVKVHRVTIARIETGRLTPSSDVLYSLADALGVETDQLRQVAEIPGK